MRNFELFLEKYNKDYISHLKMNDDLKKKFNKFFKFTLNVKKNKKKNYNFWQWWKRLYSKSF